jgi:light-regulated signal transduction histidine kinase (bacteriophytochrome)
MQNLIEDLLTYSQLGRKEIKETEVDLETIFLDVFKEFQLLYPERKFEFKLHHLPHVFGDEIMLRQVVMNLISNAIKYTRKKEVALVDVGFADDNIAPLFYVKDNGVGFSMHEIGKLFTVFQRLHPPEEFEGIGAGLAIVKRILERHGGKIWAESKINVGTTFYFTLPIAATKQRAA